jgi:hypothetical protein
MWHVVVMSKLEVRTCASVNFRVNRKNYVRIPPQSKADMSAAALDRQIKPIYGRYQPWIQTLIFSLHII